MQKHANLVDLVKRFPFFVYFYGVDTAENEPLNVHLVIQPWDFIFTEPPSPEVFLPSNDLGMSAARGARGW